MELGSIWLWGTWALLVPCIILDLGDSPPLLTTPTHPPRETVRQTATARENRVPSCQLSCHVVDGYHVKLFSMGTTAVVGSVGQTFVGWLIIGHSLNSVKFVNSVSCHAVMWTYCHVIVSVAVIVSWRVSM